MANQKISQLTEQTDLSLIDGLAGYEGTSNVRISGPNIISAIPTMYSADDDLLAFRTVNDRTGGFTGTAGNNAIKFNFRNSGAIIIAGYLNNGDSGNANNLLRWGPGLTNGSMNVRGDLALSSGGGAIKLTNSGGQQYLTMAQTGTTINTNVGFGLTTGVSARLHVKGSGSTSATTSLLVEDSLGDDILSVRDDQYVTITGNNSTDNFFILKNNATWTMLDAGDTAGNNGQLRIKSNNNNRFWFKANAGLSIGDVGAVTLDASAVLKADSITKGFLPPRMTTAQKNAIASPTTGLVLFDTDENNLQYYNGDWNPTGLTPNSQLLAMTEITATATGNVTHDIHNFSSTPSNNLTAVNFDSDGTNRYAKIVFTPTYTGKAKIVFTSYTNIVGGSNDISIGLHDRATSTTTPVYGWFMVVEDDEPANKRILKAEWIVDVFADEQFVGYVQAIANGSGNQFVASNYQGAAWSSSNKYAGPALVEAYSIENISITTNPTG